jgi:hypothetical protein
MAVDADLLAPTPAGEEKYGGGTPLFREPEPGPWGGMFDS